MCWRRRGGRVLAELAQQQAAQAVECEQGVGVAFRCGQVVVGCKAGGCAAFGGRHVDHLAIGLAHRIAHGLHAAELEPINLRQIEPPQLRAQRLGHGAHPVVPHLRRDLHLRHHGLQRL